jgi:hypothetical protein
LTINAPRDAGSRYASRAGAVVSAAYEALLRFANEIFGDPQSQGNLRVNDATILIGPADAVGNISMTLELIENVERVAHSASNDAGTGPSAAGATLYSTYPAFAAALVAPAIPGGAGAGLLDGVVPGAANPAQRDALENYIIDRWLADGMHPDTAARFAAAGGPDSGHAGADNLAWHMLRALIAAAEEGDVSKVCVRLGANCDGIQDGPGFTFRTLRAMTILLENL